jgi:ribosome modulation factor
MTAAQDAFRLSRIHAQGWNAARTPGATEQSNPWPAEPERSRWQAGFAGARTDVRKKPA